VAGSYVTVGSGDHRVLALHSWFGSARGWGSLPEFLDGSAYTWVFMNLRGYGDRPDTAGEFTVDEVAADTPVKLIVGVNDPALSADLMEQTWMVTFPDAGLTILPDAGHYPMFESPVSLATSIEEFLGRA